MEKKLGDAAASQSLRGSLPCQIGNPPEIIDQAGGDRFHHTAIVIPGGKCVGRGARSTPPHSTRLDASPSFAIRHQAAVGTGPDVLNRAQSPGVVHFMDRRHTFVGPLTVGKEPWIPLNASVCSSHTLRLSPRSMSASRTLRSSCA